MAARAEGRLLRTEGHSEAVTVLAVLAVLARSRAVRTDPVFRPAIEYRVTLRPAAGLPVILRSRG